MSIILAQVKPVDPGTIGTVIAIALLVAVFAARRLMQGKSAPKSPAGANPPFVYSTHPVIEPLPGARPLPNPSVIASIRQLMGPPPRAFKSSLTKYLAVVPPRWMHSNPNDEEWINIKNQDRLRREGMVVWSVIVQANNNLFKKNGNESGASVIYSSDPWFDSNREALARIAGQCFALKGTDPADPESAAFARMLTNERTRGMRMKVPSLFTGGREVYHSSMLMPRKHLPKGYISGSYFPVWMDDTQKTGAVVMVPAAYWPASLTMEWSAD